MLYCYCDGGFSNLKGEYYGSFKVFEHKPWKSLVDIEELLAGRKYFADTASTSNEAEYCALIYLLEALKENGYSETLVYVYSDSQLVVKQVAGNWKVKAGNLKELNLRAKELVSEFEHLNLEWVPRKVNVKILGH